MTRQNIEDLRRSGVTSFPFFKPSECQAMLQEAQLNPLTLAQKEVGPRKVRQQFFEVTLDTPTSVIATAVLNVQEYLHNIIVAYDGPQAFASPLHFNEVRLHKYPPGGLLDFHRDDKVFKNLIVNVLLKGESCFYVADDINGTNKKLVPAWVGWCVALSAPGLFGGRKQPAHCVAQVTTERWTLGMRDRLLVQE